MRSSIVILLVVAIIGLVGCSQEESDQAVLTQTIEERSDFDPAMQLTEKDRNAKAEASFIKQLKTVIKLDDKVGFKNLYYLENANAEYLSMIDYVYDKNWNKHLKDLEISIEVNQKAQRHNMTFTTPYLGDLVILLENQYGRSKTKIPLGIKDGVYYFTLAATN